MNELDQRNERDIKLVRSLIYFEEDGSVVAAGNFDDNQQPRLVNALLEKGLVSSANALKEIFQTINQYQNLESWKSNGDFLSGCTHCMIKSDVDTPIGEDNDDFKSEEERILAEKLMSLNYISILPDDVLEVFGLSKDFFEEYEPDELYKGDE